jgi:hypothetical protein
MTGGINRISPVLTEGSFWELVGGLFFICQCLANRLFFAGNRIGTAWHKPVADLPQLADKLSATCVRL